MVFKTVSFVMLLQKIWIYSDGVGGRYNLRFVFDLHLERWGILREPLFITDGLISYNWSHKSAKLLS